MRLVAASADRGVRFTLWQDQQTRQKAGLLVRRIPAEVAKEIENEILGHRKRVTKFKKGVQIVEYDPAQSEEITYRKAAYALVDSWGNAEVPAAHVPALAAAAQDGFVVLDGHWTDEVKRQVFEALPNIAFAAIRCAERLDAIEIEEEEGKGETS